MQKEYGRLTFLEAVNKNGRIYWLCRCKCGSEKAIRSDKVRSGHTQSCGCLKAESDKIKLCQKTHGLRKTPEYAVWNTMLSRCHNINSEKYKDYGGRGIAVCAEWHVFENFIKDMGFRPSKHHSIERINNSENYCKENCRWATRIEQQNNKRNNVKITLDGVTKSAKEWASLTGLSYKLIHSRHKKGWPAEKILQPIAAVPSEASKSLNTELNHVLNDPKPRCC